MKTKAKPSSTHSLLNSTTHKRRRRPASSHTMKDQRLHNNDVNNVRGQRCKYDKRKRASASAKHERNTKDNGLSIWDDSEASLKVYVDVSSSSSSSSSSCSSDSTSSSSDSDSSSSDSSVVERYNNRARSTSQSTGMRSNSMPPSYYRNNLQPSRDEDNTNRDGHSYYSAYQQRSQSYQSRSSSGNERIISRSWNGEGNPLSGFAEFLGGDFISPSPTTTTTTTSNNRKLSRERAAAQRENEQKQRRKQKQQKLRRSSIAPPLVSYAEFLENYDSSNNSIMNNSSSVTTSPSSTETQLEEITSTPFLSLMDEDFQRSIVAQQRRNQKQQRKQNRKKKKKEQQQQQQKQNHPQSFEKKSLLTTTWDSTGRSSSSKLTTIVEDDCHRGSDDDIDLNSLRRVQRARSRVNNGDKQQTMSAGQSSSEDGSSNADNSNPSSSSSPPSYQRIMKMPYAKQKSDPVESDDNFMLLSSPLSVTGTNSVECDATNYFAPLPLTSNFAKRKRGILFHRRAMKGGGGTNDQANAVDAIFPKMRVRSRGSKKKGIKFRDRFMYNWDDGVYENDMILEEGKVEMCAADVAAGVVPATDPTSAQNTNKNNPTEVKDRRMAYKRSDTLNSLQTTSTMTTADSTLSSSLPNYTRQHSSSSLYASAITFSSMKSYLSRSQIYRLEDAPRELTDILNQQLTILKTRRQDILDKARWRNHYGQRLSIDDSIQIENSIQFSLFVMKDKVEQLQEILGPLNVVVYSSDSSSSYSGGQCSAVTESESSAEEEGVLLHVGGGAVQTVAA